MAYLPHDDEIRAVGESLGHGPGPYSTKVKAQLVKTIQLATKESMEVHSSEVSLVAFCVRLVEVYNGLTEAGLPIAAAHPVIGALAPVIYRETRTPHP